MVKKSKQTPLTAETFKKLFMPVFNEKFLNIDKQFKSVRNDVTKIVHKVNDLKEIVEETNKRVKFLPTTETYLSSQDKLMGELKKSTEATALTGQHYKDTNDRVDEIDKYLNINSRLAI